MSAFLGSEPLRAVGVSASPSGSASRSRELMELALERLSRAGLAVEHINLSRLPAAALLGREPDPGVSEALSRVQGARVLVVATPVYRATYSGLLKVFFDLLPHGALAGKVVVPIATGGSSAHQLAIDHGLRPLIASLGGLAAATGIYAQPEQFALGRAEPALVERVERAVAEAIDLSVTLRPPTPVAAHT